MCHALIIPSHCMRNYLRIICFPCAITFLKNDFSQKKTVIEKKRMVALNCLLYDRDNSDHHSTC